MNQKPPLDLSGFYGSERYFKHLYPVLLTKGEVPCRQRMLLAHGSDRQLRKKEVFQIWEIAVDDKNQCSSHLPRG